MKQALSLLSRTSLRNLPKIGINCRPSFKLYQTPKFCLFNLGLLSVIKRMLKSNRPLSKKHPSKNPH